MKWTTITLATIILISAAAPVLTSYDPLSIDSNAALQPPSLAHWFGTDHLGRDVYSRVLFGGRQTLLLSIIATSITVSIGLPIGLLVGLNVKWLDWGVVTLLNAMLAFPGLLVAMVVLTLIGSSNMGAAIAVGIAQIAGFGHVVRAAVIAVKTQGYVDAAVGLGASRWHIVRWHIWRNILPIVLSYTAVIFSYSIINTASLSFLGLSNNPAVPDWGSMLADGRIAFRIAPWAVIFPAIAIAITISSINTLVDALSER